MFFLMRCIHHPDMDAQRDALRPTHRDWVKSAGGNSASCLIGSALWKDDGSALGHFGILQAESGAKARAFAEGDPFNTGGVVAEIHITRLADGFQSDRVSEWMSRVSG
ncbi:YciI family protein [Pseudoprimorskyibacter insulae]|uniref:YCII-related domain-containing protein n=1 Tax=Pseudoprimorskyibacter insulae TaxID=1695997 RepID=A0A2R8AW16_9RHOB|nr:YciI family protein [Pseudoprimorskyibacter insulae]SPF80216.1 hypothetical protein PRI8871_02022 [Pseudoprimorskyibacter insulae]